MRKGEEGDFMYVIISGECGIYLDDTLTNCILSISDTKVFGEKALETDDKRYYSSLINILRGASIKAHTYTQCLILHKNDFKNVIYHVKMLQKSQRQNFIMQVPLFKDWSFIKIVELNNLLAE